MYDFLTLAALLPVSIAAEFSVPVCTSDDDVPRLLITENDTSYIKVTFTKTGWCEYCVSLKSNLLLILFWQWKENKLIYIVK